MLENQDNIDIEKNTPSTDDKPSEVELRASRMGWVNEDKFRGDKDKWISAQEFVERGETQIPILKERLKKMDDTVVGLKGTISGMKETFSKFKTWHSETVANQYKKAERDIIKKQREATENSDVDAFDALEKEKEALKKEMQDKTAQAIEDSNANDGISHEAMAIFDKWREGNEWFDDNPIMREYARVMSVEIQNEKGLGGKALYDAVARDVKKRFPENFENKKRDAPNAVMGDGDPGPINNKKQSFSNLPKDAQDQCLEFIKTIPGFTKEEYVKNYEWD